MTHTCRHAHNVAECLPVTWKPAALHTDGYLAGGPRMQRTLRTRARAHTCTQTNKQTHTHTHTHTSMYSTHLSMHHGSLHHLRWCVWRPRVNSWSARRRVADATTRNQKQKQRSRHPVKKEKQKQRSQQTQVHECRRVVPARRSPSACCLRFGSSDLLLRCIHGECKCGKMLYFHTCKLMHFQGRFGRQA